jgi:hypothetical protein
MHRSCHATPVAHAAPVCAEIYWFAQKTKIIKKHQNNVGAVDVLWKTTVHEPYALGSRTSIPVVPEIQNVSGRPVPEIQNDSGMFPGRPVPEIQNVFVGSGTYCPSTGLNFAN